MVAAAEAFFEANEEVESCKKRRTNRIEESQKRHAKALLRFTLYTEELDKLVEVRKEARNKVDEAHIWQSAVGVDGGVLEKMLETLREGT